MAITPAERDVLLKRLELARQAKIAKKQAVLDAKKTVEVSAVAPVIEPKPEPKEELPPPNLLAMTEPEEEIKLPPKIKKGKAKKIVESSDSEDMDQEPVKKQPKKGGKKTAYMKIKIYREPSNPVAFSNLLESLNDTYEEPEPSKPIPIPVPPQRVLTGSSKKEQSNKPLNTNRALALSFFQ